MIYLFSKASYLDQFLLAWRYNIILILASKLIYHWFMEDLTGASFYPLRIRIFLQRIRTFSP